MNGKLVSIVYTRKELEGIEDSGNKRDNNKKQIDVSNIYCGNQT